MSKEKKSEEKKTEKAEENLLIRESSIKKRERKTKKTKQNEGEEKKEEKTKRKSKKEEEKETEKAEEKEEKEILLAPLEDYIKAGVHLGTRAVTPNMRQYVYRRRADGVAVLNTKKIDEKIAVAADFLAQYPSEDIIVCCKRDAGHAALEAFKEATGVRTFTRYPAGIITNPTLENFFEPKVVFIIDPWLDKNVLQDAVKIHVPVIALCDTNNMTTNIDVVVPCNNKTAKSIGLVLYLIAKLYLDKKGIKKKLNPKEFYELEETEPALQASKKKIEKRAEELLEKLRKKIEKKEDKAEEEKEGKEEEEEKKKGKAEEEKKEEVKEEKERKKEEKTKRKSKKEEVKEEKA